MRAPDDTSTSFPALRDYAERIGAEQRNFRRYVIREQERELYHYDKYLISLAADGEVSVREARGGEVPDEIKPTEAEQIAIKEGCASANWPKYIHATQASVDYPLRELVGRDAELFVYRNAANEVPFVQQRIYQDDGGKADLPWTLWSDGKWRCMEPDGLLPLWGLDQLKTAACVFIHEGAKTAIHVLRMLEEIQRNPDIDPHPWYHQLVGAAHLGWPGGAPNAHRVDWEPIRRLSPHVRVIVVCDNDPPGENAAPVISRACLRRMWTIRFGAAFKRAFDLADTFPKDGPSYDDCLEPATWATMGKRLRAEFVEEWMFTVKPTSFMHRERMHRRYDEAEFNHHMAAFSDLPNVAVMLRRYPSAKADGLVYEPGKATGRIALERQQVINAYQPSSIEPIAGDVGLFEEFLEHLIPGKDDCLEVKRWCATLIAKPDTRMIYGMLLISHTQGVGKTTLAEKVLVPLVGEANCSFPNPATAVNSQFTSWLAYKRLAVIAEIYDGHTAKAYNKLKGYITDEYVRVEEKYQNEYYLKNFIHVLASSNSFRALKIDDQDRRWFIPGVTEEVKPHSYWVTLRRWLADGGLNAIADWAPKFIDEHGPVATGVHAPISEAKKRAIEEGHSDGERLVSDLGQDIRDREKRTVVRLDEIRKWLAERKATMNSRLYGSDGSLLLETPERIVSLLRSRGLVLPGTRFKVGGERFRIATNFPVEPNAKWEQLAEHYWLPDSM